MCVAAWSRCISEQASICASCCRVSVVSRFAEQLYQNSEHLRALVLIGFSGGNLHPDVCFFPFLLVHTRLLLSSFLPSVTTLRTPIIPRQIHACQFQIPNRPISLSSANPLFLSLLSGSLTFLLLLFLLCFPAPPLCCARGPSFSSFQSFRSPLALRLPSIPSSSAPSSFLMKISSVSPPSDSDSLNSSSSHLQFEIMMVKAAFLVDFLANQTIQ